MVKKNRTSLIGVRTRRRLPLPSIAELRRIKRYEQFRRYGRFL
jgi:hypothetical protein